MAKMLNRLWTGIVASLAGIAIGIVVMIILIQSKMPMDRALSACWIGAAVGFVSGVLLARPNKPPQSL